MLLHADRHVLDDMVLALVSELELAEAAHPKIDVGQAAPARVVRAITARSVSARRQSRVRKVDAAVRVIMRCM